MIKWRLIPKGIVTRSVVHEVTEELRRRQFLAYMFRIPKQLRTVTVNGNTGFFCVRVCVLDQKSLPTSVHLATRLSCVSKRTEYDADLNGACASERGSAR